MDLILKTVPHFRGTPSVEFELLLSLGAPSEGQNNSEMFEIGMNNFVMAARCENSGVPHRHPEAVNATTALAGDEVAFPGPGFLTLHYRPGTSFAEEDI